MDNDLDPKIKEMPKKEKNKEPAVEVLCCQ
jgi:hypothetical protein